eukprot:gene2-3400_t
MAKSASFAYTISFNMRQQVSNKQSQDGYMKEITVKTYKKVANSANKYCTCSFKMEHVPQNNCWHYGKFSSCLMCGLLPSRVSAVTIVVDNHLSYFCKSMLSQWELNLELSFSPKEDNIDCSSINFSQLCALYQKRISPFINFCQNRGISRDSWHKRRATGGRRKPIRMKRKFELGRPPAMTKIMGPKRIHTVRTMGGNTKYRALRLENGNFSWASEGFSRKTRLIDVVYNASNNELVRTKTLVKNAILQVDATPFKSWYESHYGVVLGKKKATDVDSKKVKPTKATQKKLEARRKGLKMDPKLEEQFHTGRLYVAACVASRPGQSGRCDGYILEGKELEFYLKKLKSKR